MWALPLAIAIILFISLKILQNSASYSLDDSSISFWHIHDFRLVGVLSLCRKFYSNITIITDSQTLQRRITWNRIIVVIQYRDALLTGLSPLNRIAPNTTCEYYSQSRRIWVWSLLNGCLCERVRIHSLHAAHKTESMSWLSIKVRLFVSYVARHFNKMIHFLRQWHTKFSRWYSYWLITIVNKQTANTNFLYQLNGSWHSVS